jgi:hypothetical protein
MCAKNRLSTASITVRRNVVCILCVEIEPTLDYNIDKHNSA